MQVKPAKLREKTCPVSTIFSWRAEEFDQLLAVRGKNDDIQLTLKYVNNTNAKILEAGCGTGCVVKYLYDLGFKNISGIEINKTTVNEISFRHPELDIIVGDILAMPYEQASFDVVLSYGVVEHFPVVGPSIPLKALFDVLRPGGIAIITVPSFNMLRRISYMLNLCDVRKWNWLRKHFNKSLFKRNGKVHGWYIDPQFGAFFEYRFTKRQFEQLCINAGFEIIESVPISHIDGLFHSFARPLVTFKNWFFSVSKAGKFLNALFLLIPFFHNHMHACVLRKPPLKDKK